MREIHGKIHFVIGLFLLMGSVARADFSVRGDILLFGDNRELNQEQFSEYKNLNEIYGIMGADFAYLHDIYQFEIRPELRMVQSPGVGLDKTDVAYTTVTAPPRFFNLHQQLGKNGSSQEELDIEKLNFSIQTKHTEFAIGRRPLGLGVLKFLPVWNKFTVILPTQAGPPIIYNPDNILLRYQTGSWSEAILGIGGPKQEDMVSLGQINYFGDWIEVQTLFGDWWDHSVAGLAFTKDIYGLTLRFESLWVGLNATDKEHLSQIGLGLEYAFTDKLSAIMESLYLSNGADRTSQYELIPVSRFSPYRAKGYSMISLDYKFLPTWHLSTGPLVNIVDGSVLYLADLHWSTSDDSELVLQTKTPIGPAGTEFSANSFQFEDGSFIGYPYVFNLFYKVYF